MEWHKDILISNNFSFVLIFSKHHVSLITVVSIRRRQDEYHPQLEKSEFYSMENLSKQAVLFNPIPEYEENNTKMLGLDIETGNAIIT